MEQAVAALSGQTVKIRGRRRLKGSSMIEYWKGPVTKAIKQDKDDFH
jgi:hypothetical protein